ncbi:MULTISPECIES: hypothetical protein [Actinoalloteichus]|uniref:Uncharacterized protein n=1 Tax=Actinoalloteichus fjordicus TaxID=1612552 RepID=A0AAC9LGA1_9PSEU|nr:MULTISPECIES: hypothetical protein [Actinoalloteichus]APU15719.1 hypothetical protein UA74_18455 [Actinoalloteichus fjordicus]APU21779.1 hypothetical protein UA75_18945 [Actinoalloteichus sp. GBA129-24]
MSTRLKRRRRWVAGLPSRWGSVGALRRLPALRIRSYLGVVLWPVDGDHS